MSKLAATRFATRLDKELSWRKRELVSLYLDIPNDLNDDTCSTKCRAALLMLYAHWEGFVKSAFTAYIEEAASCVSDPRQYNDSLLGLSVKGWVQKVAKRRDSTELGKVLRQAMDANAPLPLFRTKALVQTQSNVSPKVLNEILLTVGLEVGRFREYESTLIKPLVGSRNEIAHGGDAPVLMPRFRLFHHRVMDLIDKVRLYLEDCLINSVYLK